MIQENGTKHHKIMPERIVFFFAEDSAHKSTDASELKVLIDGCSKALVDTLNPTYPIGADPGSRRVAAAVRDQGLKQSNPVFSGVTSVVPMGLAVSIVKRAPPVAGPAQGRGCGNDGPGLPVQQGDRGGR